MRKIEKFEQDTTASVWLHLVPEGRTSIVVIGAFSADGRATFPSSDYTWDVTDGMLKVDFGLDSANGYILYEYEDGQPGSVITTGSNTVTINVTQNGGSSPSGSTF